MKCPACENDVPSGRTACTRCGAPLPSAGERPTSEPRFASGPTADPRAGSPNPTTEPLPVTDWEEADEKPWAATPAPYPGTGTDPNPPYPGTGTDPSPPYPGAGTDPSPPYPGAGTDPSPPYPGAGTDPSPPYPGAGTDPGPSDPGAATHNLGAPPVHRAPFEPGQPAPPEPPQPPAYPLPPEPDNATRSFGAPGSGRPLPGAFDPASWDQHIPPAAGDGTPPPPGDSTGKNIKGPLLAAGVAAVVVLGAGLVYVLAKGLPGSNDATNTSTGKPGAKSSAQQAAAVNEILRSGRTARGHLPAPLRTCDDVSAGVSGFQQVVRDRQQELSQSKGLKVDQLQDGPRLRRSMVTAYQRSLDADQAYLAWAQEIQARGCGDKIAPLTAHYKAAISANGKAGPAKRQVVARWNPIATNHGLPTYVWNRL